MHAVSIRLIHEATGGVVLNAVPLAAFIFCLDHAVVSNKELDIAWDAEQTP